MPIRDRIAPFNPDPCGPGCYGVLVPVSQRYPPVAGRLHTRYAPVRRSPAVYCYTPLPLDLHVLGLPLAFILSQDQTLHCKNCSLTFDSSRVSQPASADRYDTRYLLFQNNSKFSCFLSTLGVSRKANAKIRPFFKLQKFFFTFFVKNRINSYESTLIFFHFFAHTPISRPAKPPFPPTNYKILTLHHRNPLLITLYIID